MTFNFISVFDFFVRRTYLSAGLRPLSIPLDDEDKTTIHCWLPPSLHPDSTTAKTAQKPVLILIHGFGPQGTWQWRCQINSLSKHFDLIVPDLVFFGSSTTSSPLRSESSLQAVALCKLIEKIVKGRRVSVAGTSYGGFVAYHVGRMLGEERVEKVVIASSNVLKSSEDDRKFVQRAGVDKVEEIMLPESTEMLRKLLKLCVHRPPPFMPECILRDVLKKLYKDNMEEKLQLLKGISLGNKDEFQCTPLSQEVLIIWGEYDQIFPVEKAFELKKHLGERVKLEIIKKTGHMPQMEDPSRFNQVMLDFLLGVHRPSK